MNLISWGNGVKPRRHALCRLMRHQHSMTKFGFISSDILGCQDIRPSTSRFIQMRPGTYFDIKFEIAGSAMVETALRAGDEAEVFKFARENLQPNSALLVACLGDGVDYGNLIIEVDAQGDTEVRALEHRGFLVKHVSVEQALSVLEYWLPSQDRSPSVQWLEE